MVLRINILVPLSIFWSLDFVIAYKSQVSECFVYLSSLCLMSAVVCVSGLSIIDCNIRFLIC
jgi:hypothetical protein